MLQNIIRVIFIVMYAIVLSGFVIFGIEEIRGGSVLMTCLCALGGIFSIHRIVYYAKGLSQKCEEE